VRVEEQQARDLERCLREGEATRGEEEMQQQMDLLKGLVEKIHKQGEIAARAEKEKAVSSPRVMISRLI
jgi:hypothetical protein